LYCTYYFMRIAFRFSIIERIIFKTTIIGPPLRFITLERFFAALGVTHSSGIPENEAYNLAASESRSATINRLVRISASDCGGKIAESFYRRSEQARLISPLIRETLSQTHATDEIMLRVKRITSFYQESLLAYVSPLLIVFQPLVVLLAGIGMLTLLIALYRPAGK
jgi:type II secretory pathway component PulF